jgi:Tfp pilus assembly protein PilV
MSIVNRKQNRLSGFSLIEAIASAGILAIGIVAVVSGIGAVSRAESRIRQVDKMTSLAQHKYEELIATSTTLTAQTGDFKDQYEQDYQWSAAVDQTGVTNLVALTVTVTSIVDTSSKAPQAKVTGLMYQPPTTTTGATP